MSDPELEELKLGVTAWADRFQGECLSGKYPGFADIATECNSAEWLAFTVRLIDALRAAVLAPGTKFDPSKPKRTTDALRAVQATPYDVYALSALWSMLPVETKNARWFDVDALAAEAKAEVAPS